MVYTGGPKAATLTQNYILVRREHECLNSADFKHSYTLLESLSWAFIASHYITVAKEDWRVYSLALRQISAIDVSFSSKIIIITFMRRPEQANHVCVLTPLLICHRNCSVIIFSPSTSTQRITAPQLMPTEKIFSSVQVQGRWSAAIIGLWRAFTRIGQSGD